MWEPATGIEHQMRDALRAGRQEEYFQLLAGLELLLPVSDDHSTYTEPDTWATWSTEERTHVLAFTSEQALQACLKAHAGPFRRANFVLLSETWPDAEWWLAVNPGLPIEGYLPSWFVTQIARGDTSMPGEGPTSAPPRQTAPDWRAEAAASAWPSDPVQPPPPPTDQLGSRAERYSALPTRRPTEPTANGYDSPIGDSQPIGGHAGFGAAPPAGPGFGAAPGGLPTRTPSESGFGSTGYEPMSAPPAAAPGGLPTRTPEPAPAGFGEAPAYDAPAYDQSSYGRPASDDAYGWGEPPAEYPSSTSYTPEPVAAPPPSAPVSDEWLADDQAEARLAEAASSGDTEAFLNVLMRSWAYVPVGDGGAAAARPGEHGFRWYTDLIDGAYTVTAFTSPVRLAARYGDRAYTRTTFSRVAANWPGLEYSLYVNPGTEVGANMPGPQVTTLLTWARAKGLIDLAQSMEQGPTTPSGPTPVALGRPDWMQKVVPHHQVALILERGYDRVAGFVHRLADVEHLTTPAALYDGLGLVRPDGRFDRADTEVHLLRWVGYCHDLYQIAYGANDSQSLSQTGGWVVEAPPFTGTGFAPSADGAAVTEYKVDSVRLPHGARIYRMGAGGALDEVASFDADRREWVQTRFGGGWDTAAARSQEQQHA